MTAFSSFVVLPALLLVMLGFFLSHFESADALPECKCQEPEVNQQFDQCTAAGLFKSNSMLRKSTTDSVILPYDYYQCVTYGATFIRYTRRCSSQYIFYKTTTDGVTSEEKYLNAFDGGSKTCSTNLPNGAQVYECTIPQKCPVVDQCRLSN